MQAGTPVDSGWVSCMLFDDSPLTSSVLQYLVWCKPLPQCIMVLVNRPPSPLNTFFLLPHSTFSLFVGFGVFGWSLYRHFPSAWTPDQLIFKTAHWGNPSSCCHPLPISVLQRLDPPDSLYLCLPLLVEWSHPPLPHPPPPLSFGLR